MVVQPQGVFLSSQEGGKSAQPPPQLSLFPLTSGSCVQVFLQAFPCSVSGEKVSVNGTYQALFHPVTMQEYDHGWHTEYERDCLVGAIHEKTEDNWTQGAGQRETKKHTGAEEETEIWRERDRQKA